MPKANIAHVNGAVIRWARERAGLTPQALALKISKNLPEETVIAWEEDEGSPTFTQAERIAEQLRVPLAILFMSEPPKMQLRIPDLRTVAGRPIAKPSLDFLDTLNDSLAKQVWYREYQQEQGAEPISVVGRFRLGDNIQVVASDIVETLGIDDELRHQSSSWQHFKGEFFRRVEGIGILLMRNSVAGHASNRKLNVEEFRGFALSDPLAPVIFINSADAEAAQVFTLAHELAHIWISQSGISNPRPKDPRPAHPIERYCNAVAEEVLIPSDNVDRMWRNEQSTDTNIGQIATFHRVSKLVTIIRSRNLNRISAGTASRLIDAEFERFRAEQAKQKEKQDESEGGPSFWMSFGPRNSYRFVDTVVSALQEGAVLHLEAATLLGVKLKTLDKYFARPQGER